jgi:hypothetical protein
LSVNRLERLASIVARLTLAEARHARTMIDASIVGNSLGVRRRRRGRRPRGHRAWRLRAEIPETALYKAFATLTTREDEQDTSNAIREELMRLEAEVGRLAQAIPARGELPAFVEAMSVGNISTLRRRLPREWLSAL